MPKNLDYRWNLRQVMAGREMFATTDLLAPLAARGITLSSSQVYRLVVAKDYRVIYQIRDQAARVLVLKGGDRKDVYRRIGDLKRLLR